MSWVIVQISPRNFVSDRVICIPAVNKTKNQLERNERGKCTGTRNAPMGL